jgi:hypothetical protein
MGQCLSHNGLMAEQGPERCKICGSWANSEDSLDGNIMTDGRFCRSTLYLRRCFYALVYIQTPDKYKSKRRPGGHKTWLVKLVMKQYPSVVHPCEAVAKENFILTKACKDRVYIHKFRSSTSRRQVINES